MTDVIAEDLHCIGAKVAPSHVTIDKSDVSVSGHYSFPLSALKSMGEGSWDEPLEYDIVLDWHSVEKDAEYRIDVETRSDFLTGQMTFQMLYENKAK